YKALEGRTLPPDAGISGWDAFHGSLDAAGLAPGVGIIPDGINALVYTIRGKWVDAGWSLGAMIPAAGQGVMAAKYGTKIDDVIEGTEEAVDLASSSTVVREFDEIVDESASRVVSNNPALELGDTISIRVEMHGTLKNDSTISGQSHHLNQDAAFKSVIPTNDAVAVKLEGNAFSEIDSPHYNAHESLETFWNQYRRGGEFAGEKPTNKEYTRALYQSLIDSGMSEANAWRATKSAMKQRVEYGLKGNSPVPRIPGRIGQRRRE
ncbi:hypothetical protein L4D12_00375, partial [Photobacterium nomapromontoriensis]